FSASGDAVALLYTAFPDPVLLTVGPAPQLQPVFDEVDAALGACRQLYLSVRPDVLPLLQQRYRASWTRLMQRMLLDRRRFRPGEAREVCPLGPADLEAVRALYADGDATGEAPDFFAPTMLEQGVFCGIREGAALVAAAGTHIVARGEGVGAVGNVYTRRDR